MSLTPGSRVGPYEILALIGMGGMGEVYRARDPRLKREIAIKVVSRHHAQDSEHRERFEREASALAALTHPHICRLYDVGREGDMDFLVMELLDGETLAEYIERTPSASINDVVTIAHDVADAVHQAHRVGLLHRDLKPGNVMITTGGVKLLDFGLAKLFDEAPSGTIGTTTSALTGEGKIPGTVQYMAPEQLLGKEVSIRVDIFAMGAIIYELLAGRPPFSGPTAVATIAAILSEPPTPLLQLRPDVPPSLVKIVERCLEKSADKRFPTAGALAEALSAVLAPGRRRRALVANPSGRASKRLARAITVLPFRNLGAPTRDYLAAGLTDALIQSLARIRELRIITQSSSTHARDQDADPIEAMNGLKVDAWIEGTVAETRDQIRVSVRMIHAITHECLWAATYERPAEAVPGTEGVMAEAIVAELQVKLRSSGRRRYHKHSVEPRAQEAYLRARFHWQNRTAESLKVSLRYFQAALEADPQYALAHSGLAEWYVAAAMARVVSQGEAMARAKEAATKALQLDPMLAEAHSCLGSILLGDWELGRAKHELETAVLLNASLASAHVLLARLFAYTKDFTSALAQIVEAQRLDPTSPWVHVNAASTYYAARQYNRAIEEAERTLQFSPSLANAFYLMGLSKYFLGDSDRALEFLQRARSVAPEHASPVVGLAYVLAQSGRRSEAIALADELKDRATRAEVSPYDFAELHTGLGEGAVALDYLDRSFELHLPELLGIGSDPLFDPIRTEPRFRELLVRLKLSE